MFDSAAATISPRRSRLAGPVAVLAHGLVLAGLIGAAFWNAADLPLPDPPERLSLFSIPIALTSAGGSGGGGRRDSRPPRGQPRSAARASSVPTSLPDQVAANTGPELPVGGDPRQEQETPGLVDGDERGSGGCPHCTADTGSGGHKKGAVVDGSVVAPILIRRVEPIYPEGLRKLHLEGLVILEAIIATNGSIEEFRVVSSANPLFDESAVRAVGQWRYEPCLLAGRPVRVRLLVTVVFRLN
jgi:TonB family protein